MSSLDAVRRPEYTGERRCWPCTLLNAALVTGLAAVVARRRRGLAVALVGVGATLLWLRGYVVPYTPRVAPRLVAAAPLPDEWFRSGPALPEDRDPGGLGPDAVDGEAVLAGLVEAGAVRVDDEGVDLDPAFERAWRAEMAPLAARDTGALAAAVEALVPGASANVEAGLDGEWVVFAADGGGAESWLSRPVAVAETAAVRALDGRLPADMARAAATPLRMLLTDCPDCGTALERSTSVDCCGGHTTPLSVPDEVLACPACRVRLFTFEE